MPRPGGEPATMAIGDVADTPIATSLQIKRALGRELADDGGISKQAQIRR